MKILIAEDDMFIREGLQDLLDAEGYQCIVAEDGQQAWDLFQSQQPDLLLLDIMMPKKDGYTLCREIRQQDESIPIVFLTAKSEEIDQVLGLELGADDYIMKPFGTREIVARIRAVSRRCLKQKNTQNNVENSFTMKDLTIHIDELRAQRNDKLLELSLRDIKILQLLYDNKGKVVDRDSLFNVCWGRDYLPSSRTLDQHISNLRKIIEQDAKNPDIIKTVHGAGYRFDD